MTSGRVLALLLVLTTSATAIDILGGIRRYPSEVTPCAAMQCPEGTRCEEGRVICPFVPPCFTRPTTCVPNGYYDAEPIFEFGEEGSSGSGEEFSGSGDEGFGSSDEGSSSGEEGAGNCAMNMYSATCGPLCPQDCSNEVTCQAITCTDEERCFCNSGYVLQNKDDPSLGCVLPEECPAAL